MAPARMTAAPASDFDGESEQAGMLGRADDGARHQRGRGADARERGQRERQRDADGGRPARAAMLPMIAPAAAAIAAPIAP